MACGHGGEIELEYRAERQAAGIEVAKRKGVYKGRKSGTTKAEPSRAKQLRAKGLTVAEIAQALGTNKRTVQRYLKADAMQRPQRSTRDCVRPTGSLTHNQNYGIER